MKKDGENTIGVQKNNPISPKGQNSETDKPKIRSNIENYMCNIEIIDFFPKNEFMTFFNFFLQSGLRSFVFLVFIDKVRQVYNCVEDQKEY